VNDTLWVRLKKNRCKKKKLDHKKLFYIIIKLHLVDQP